MQEAETLAEDLKDLESIDDRGIKRIVAGLERRIHKNQELRMKHSDEPNRFVQSEMDLHEVLRKLMALAGEAELYTQLNVQQSLPQLLELLQHANLDIVSAVVDLLQELTEADSVEDLDEVRTACSFICHNLALNSCSLGPGFQASCVNLCGPEHSRTMQVLWLLNVCATSSMYSAVELVYAKYRRWQC